MENAYRKWKRDGGKRNRLGFDDCFDECFDSVGFGWNVLAGADNHFAKQSAKRFGSRIQFDVSKWTELFLWLSTKYTNHTNQKH